MLQPILDNIKWWQYARKWCMSMQLGQKHKQVLILSNLFSERNYNGIHVRILMNVFDTHPARRSSCRRMHPVGQQM